MASTKGDKMKRITMQEASDELQRHIDKGLHVGSRVLDEIKNIGSIFQFEIEDEETFLSLIWHEIDASRLFTPQGESRTLKDVAQRFIDNKISYSKLATNFGLPSDQHNPNWFSNCQKINDNFDYEEFGFIVLTPPTNEEVKQSSNGTFYIFDGSHKSFILATKLLKGELTFKSLNCFLLLPRRE